MNRLHKKCVFASAGLHTMLVLIVLFGAAFFVKEKRIPEVEPITFVPSKLVDDLLSNSGGAAPEPVAQPPPSPIPEPQPEPPREVAPPPQPEPVKVTPPPQPAPPVPKQQPPPPPPEKKTPPPDPKPATPQPKPEPPKKVERPKSQITPTFNAPKQSNAAAEAQRREREKAEAKLAEIQRNLRKGLSSNLNWQNVGAGGEAYANYGQEIMRIYEQAWQPPPEVASDSAIVTVRVRVAKNGRVLADPITTRSGHGAVDKSVQDALDRVRAAGLPPFPAGAKDNERTFIIKFNLQSKRSG